MLSIRAFDYDRRWAHIEEGHHFSITPFFCDLGSPTAAPLLLLLNLGPDQLGWDFEDAVLVRVQRKPYDGLRFLVQVCFKKRGYFQRKNLHVGPLPPCLWELSRTLNVYIILSSQLSSAEILVLSAIDHPSCSSYAPIRIIRPAIRQNLHPSKFSAKLLVGFATDNINT